MSGLFSWLVGTPCHAPSSNCPALTKHHIVSGLHIKNLDHSDFRFACLCITFGRVYITAGSQPGTFCSQGTRGQVCKHVGDAFWEQPSMLLTHPAMPTTVPQRTISPNAQCRIREAAVFAITFLVNVLFFPQSMIPTLSNMCMGKKRKD